jgi:hypothetical protein
MKENVDTPKVNHPVNGGIVDLYNEKVGDLYSCPR